MRDQDSSDTPPSPIPQSHQLLPTISRKLISGPSSARILPSSAPHSDGRRRRTTRGLDRQTRGDRPSRGIAGDRRTPQGSARLRSSRRPADREARASHTKTLGAYASRGLRSTPTTGPPDDDARPAVGRTRSARAQEREKTISPNQLDNPALACYLVARLSFRSENA